MSKTAEHASRRRYQYSSKQKAKIAAQRAVKAAEKEEKLARKAINKVNTKKRKVARRKAAATKLSRQLTGHAKPREGMVMDKEELAAAGDAIKRIAEGEEIIFRANPGPQTDFLSAAEKEVLYGGAAGGGKSYAMLVDPLRFAHHPQSSGLLCRKTMPELQELIDISRYLYSQAFPGAKYNQQEKRWRLPSGGFFQFGFVDTDSDVFQYQGKQFSWIGIDELGHYATPFVWDYLRSRLRTTAPDIETYMRATANPGGLGGYWLKKMFVDPAPWGEPFWATNIDSGDTLTFPALDQVAQELWGKPLFKRRFIPAKLSDNPYLMKSPDYLAMLSSLSEVERRRLLEGDWDVNEDAAFPEFHRPVHVCEPFHIPDQWNRFRACDYGYVAPSAVLWFAVDYDGTLYVYRELYEKGLDAQALAERIIELEWDDPGVLSGPLDNECWARRGQTGPPPAQTMIDAGVNWRRADKGPGSRVAGKVEVHRRLRVDPATELPGLVIFSNCYNLSRVMPMLPLDKKKPEDVDTDFTEDHLYDALRYGVMSRPKQSLFADERMWLRQTEQYELVDQQFGY